MNDYQFTSLTDDSYYDRETKSITHWSEILDLWDEKMKTEIGKKMPVIINDAINRANIGVIQDPAGSAIGAETVCGGGASGAIYDTFDLEPIPWINEGDSIFNSAKGDGKRVLHTHSPTLEGTPHDHDDRMNAVRSLANAYYGAINLFNISEFRDGVLNLVPVSASIFAGRFLRRGLGRGHMDPSFTFLAIAIAIGKLLEDGKPVPKMTLYFYDKDVYQRAKEYCITV